MTTDVRDVRLFKFEHMGLNFWAICAQMPSIENFAGKLTVGLE